MNITERILGVYLDCVKAGLEVKLNLWSKGGNEYFSFSKTPDTVPVLEEENEEKKGSWNSLQRSEI